MSEMKYDEYVAVMDSAIDLFGKESDESKKLLIDIMMKKYDITKEDMKDITIVKSKLRDINIDEILKQ